MLHTKQMHHTCRLNATEKWTNNTSYNKTGTAFYLPHLVMHSTHYSERKCADATDTVSVAWAGHLTLTYFSNKILGSNFIKQHLQTYCLKLPNCLSFTINFGTLSFTIHMCCVSNTHTHTRLTALFPGLPGWAGTRKVQEAQLSPRDRAMRRVNWNLANCHATVQKLLIRQALTKSMVWIIKLEIKVGGNAW